MEAEIKMTAKELDNQYIPMRPFPGGLINVDSSEKNQERKFARVSIPLTDFNYLIGLPDGHMIRDIQYNIEQRFNKMVTLLIEGPSLPEVQEGRIPPEYGILIEKRKYHIITQFIPIEMEEK